MSGMMAQSSLAKLEEMKKDIRCLLIAQGSRDVTLPKLNGLYKDMVNDNIPFKDFRYTSLKEFLSSMPDVVRLDYNKRNVLCAYHIDTEKSGHISSLVARTNTSSTGKSKGKSSHQNNPVDPRILSEVFLEVMNSPVGAFKRSRVSKEDVLAGITRRLGANCFYTMQNLNNQLNELLHLLSHNNEYIFFKKQNPTIKRKSWIDELIRDSTKAKLRQLIAKYPEGIKCSDLPRIYRRECGSDLEYSNLGFNSIIEFVGVIPDILRIVMRDKRQMVVDATVAVNNSQNHVKCGLPDRKNCTEEVTNASKSKANLCQLKFEKLRRLVSPKSYNF